MPRNNRVDIAGEIYHVINRANTRIQIFDADKDYQLFETVLKEAKDRTDIKIYSYCIMPNHWHLIVSPRNDGDLSRFMAWFTMTHTQRWHSMHKSIGSGHLYQGRYKSFLIQSNEYFLQVFRYVERNPVRAKLVKKVQDWKWGSVWRRETGTSEQQKLLSALPLNLPKNYLDWVNESEPKETLDLIRNSVNKGKPYGKMLWIEKKIDEYNLDQQYIVPEDQRKASDSIYPPVYLWKTKERLLTPFTSECKSSKKTILLKISQFITWPVAYIFFGFLYNIRIQGRENLEEICNPFVIISNHFGSTDSFLFRLILGFSPSHLPLRFMAVDKFNWKWLNFFSNIGLIPFIYKIFGVIIVTPGLGIQKNLEEAKQAIAQGENIVIYPEGRIANRGTIAPFRTGAAVLASETGAPVLPVSFRLGERSIFRRELNINIGESICILQNTDQEETTKKFHKIISDLFESKVYQKIQQYVPEV